MYVCQVSLPTYMSDCRTTDYKGLLKNQNVPLRLLVENEVFHLTVWANPTNDSKRGVDHIGTVEKVMMDVGPFWH